MKKKRSKKSRSTAKKFKVLLVLALLITSAIVLNTVPGAWSFLSKYLPFLEEPREVTVPNGEMSVHFLDVGQGDCSLIIMPDGKTMLIDASVKDEGANIAEYISRNNVNHIDYFVLTHPHADHIGGAKKVIETFPVGTVVMPDAVSDTATFENLLTAIEDKGIKLHVAALGDIIRLGNANVTVIAPVNKTDDMNNMSLVLRLDYGKTAFMFMGDAERPSENDMLNKHSASAFKANVIKLGHHGASTSSSDELLDAVMPEYAVISCGKDNSYGHPHSETVNRLNKSGIRYFQTDIDGNIVFSSNGESVTLLRPSA